MTIGAWVYPETYRTRKSSACPLMVLGGRPPGRVRNCQLHFFCLMLRDEAQLVSSADAAVPAQQNCTDCALLLSKYPHCFSLVSSPHQSRNVYVPCTETHPRSVLLCRLCVLNGYHFPARVLQVGSFLPDTLTCAGEKRFRHHLVMIQNHTFQR